MSIYEKILENMPLKYILWKLNENEENFKCYLTNNQIEINTILNTYIDKYYKNYEPMFLEFIKEKNQNKNKKIKVEEGQIFLKFLDDKHILQTLNLNNNCNIIPTLSYKLRGPLTNIIGVLNIINESSFLNKKDKKYFKILKKSSYDIMDIANDLVDIINLTRNGINLEIKKTNLTELLTDCKKIISRDLEEKKIGLIIVQKQNIPKFIDIDQNRVKQIILILLSNALKFTEVGSIIIDVSLVKKTTKNKYPFIFKEYSTPFYNILFKIKDNGSGISKDIIPHINYILEMNNNNQNNQFHKSIGYGLIIAKYLCNLMNGHIWYKTEKDIGTIFYFNIICNGEFDEDLIN